MRRVGTDSRGLASMQRIIRQGKKKKAMRASLPSKAYSPVPTSCGCRSLGPELSQHWLHRLAIQPPPINNPTVPSTSHVARYHSEKAAGATPSELLQSSHCHPALYIYLYYFSLCIDLLSILVEWKLKTGTYIIYSLTHPST